MTNTPTREHREEELRDRAEVLVDRASQGWGIAHGHYAALVRAVTQALADAEQRGFERGREAERAEVRAFLGNCGAAFRDVSAQFAVCAAIESGKHLAKEE